MLFNYILHILIGFAVQGLAVPAARSDNGTEISFTSTGDTLANPVINVALNNIKTNVGYVQGDELHAHIREALEKACKPGRSGKNFCFKHQHSIANIAWESDGEVRFDGNLEVTILEHDFPYGFHGLAEALKDAVAGAYASESQDRKNCYEKVVRNRQGKQWWCNVGSHVHVTIANHAAKGELRVALRFDKQNSRDSALRWAEGRYDCMAVREAVDHYIRKNMENFRRPLKTDTNVVVTCRDPGITANELDE